MSDSVKQVEALISAQLTEKSTDLDVREKIDRLDFLRRQGELEGIEHADVIRMRKYWSLIVLIVIMFVVGFDSAIILLYGLGWIEFESETLVMFFLGEGLFKVIGLALIIVGFLFNKDSFSMRSRS